MSGHSKWASIKHKKAATDAKRGAAFTRAIREITSIAKAGGGNPEMNPSLRTAIDKARAINMPSSNIENAIKKGTGELPGVTYEEVTFDAYGPGGVAMLITGLTDNRNRTTAEIRNILSKKSGNLAGPGSTAFLFSKKGFVAIAKDKVSEDDLMGIVLDAGAEDINSEGENHEITCEIGDLAVVTDALKAKEIPVMTAEMTMIPSTTVKVIGNDAKQLLALMEALEEQEDVQNVYANFDISDEEMEKLAQE
ncbi:MAG: transcriptional regulator [Omnitrophica WOR_2 bacterium GWF2_38_59]|nr:MAG: transcriptional regulator [Omnitrophica WOR_2 bacterium GWA2_37_7]OGX22201.1 MAG: transcriptional regulator [Omnitrophica WOR_2 bacterium GWF2_38_59]OGX46826.1 MAG: transcriptional regulator [Omnitrophica WOR_2 bacterium RIFOXYA2_FULL_38_17]OGX51626.1 MAG: transcriptional regulator [Omnitrophica WOR_2 bacterium RIFOXYA12_FULL_38_10]OGX58778.1 MAG: transcriptional regulator [Omnitrophica WOR_2 bacterium RIFOXYC2_FULL_38_12]OGX59667.1 MAG: transcriptional regulator [Omnitrophica WOR_2 ba